MDMQSALETKKAIFKQNPVQWVALTVVKFTKYYK